MDEPLATDNTMDRESAVKTRGCMCTTPLDPSVVKPTFSEVTRSLFSSRSPPHLSATPSVNDRLCVPEQLTLPTSNTGAAPAAIGRSMLPIDANLASHIIDHPRGRRGKTLSMPAFLDGCHNPRRHAIVVLCTFCSQNPT